MQRLRSSGIGESDVQTVSYTVSPEYDSSDGARITLRGYLSRTLLAPSRRLLDDQDSHSAWQRSGAVSRSRGVVRPLTEPAEQRVSN
jgi:hypothetical protein